MSTSNHPSAEALRLPRLRGQSPRFVSLVVHASEADVQVPSEGPEGCRPASRRELIDVTAGVATRIPYIAAALADEWRQSKSDVLGDHIPKVQVFMPTGCHIGILEALLGRLAVDSHCEARLTALWHPSSLTEILQLAQVASMLQIDEVMPELVGLVSEAMASGADAAELEAACERLQLPPSIQDVAATARPSCEPAGLPHTDQVRGMISSALHTADGKVWRVVQKVIDRREAWPRLAKENAGMLLGFAQGAHGSIRATPHTGFFWGSRDFLYLVCRYIRARPEIFDAMVTAMFEEVYSMDPELPAEVIDAVFKELLVHEGLTFAQCEHVIDKLMQRGEQIEYLFHEWSGVFPALPAAARQALAKGLLPSVGRCPHAALDFVLKELDALPQPEGCARHTNAWWWWYVSFGCMRRRQRWRKR